MEFLFYAEWNCKNEVYFHDFSDPVDDLSLPFITQSLTAEKDV